MKLIHAVALAVLLIGTGTVAAQAQVGLSGRVTSAEEGAMEGVLVSTKRAGGNITVTVVSDAQGNFGFPAARLEPGQYSIAIRAVGYELDTRPSVEVASAKPAQLDLKLRKTRKLSSQLSNAEWLESVPGTQQQKATFYGCVSCHTLERIVKSQHDAAAFEQVLPRMAGYANQSTPLH